MQRRSSDTELFLARIHIEESDFVSDSLKDMQSQLSASIEEDFEKAPIKVIIKSKLIF